MADIAILVAEEYERLVKNSSGKQVGGGGGGMDISWATTPISLMSGAIKRNKMMSQPTNIQVILPAGIIIEPKSQISVAASNGFFSA
ncbi:hypothetical protein Tsubulata_006091 [Turnera subulata]|uniref:Uncharacterized protein n=1 Tax=Turnera subulata TaxID=218843 RepID=A0A9Q0FGK9_9ROSI|nr:hypothetical protein Tsubulata_006091 [Turnera subulata]